MAVPQIDISMITQGLGMLAQQKDQRRREQEAREAQRRSNLGTMVGAAAGAALAIPTGGLSLAAIPAMASGASVGSGLGRTVAGLGSGNVNAAEGLNAALQGASLMGQQQAAATHQENVKNLEGALTAPEPPPLLMNPNGPQNRGQAIAGAATRVDPRLGMQFEMQRRAQAAKQGQGKKTIYDVKVGDKFIGNALTLPEARSAVEVHKQDNPRADPRIVRFSEKNAGSGGKPTTGENWSLGNGAVVTSFTGGRTYLGPDRKPVPMPTDAVRLSPTIADRTVAGAQRRGRATTELSGNAPAQPGAQASPTAAPQPTTSTPGEVPQTVLEATALGTGFKSNLAAVADKTLGQVAGQTVLPEYQKARDTVRFFGQEFDRVMANNPRFPVAEKKILKEMRTNPDSWFDNPATARTNTLRLRGRLKFMKHENLKAIAGGANREHAAKLEIENRDLDRLIKMIGNDAPAQSQPQQAPSTPKSWVIGDTIQHPEKGELIYIGDDKWEAALSL